MVPENKEKAYAKSMGEAQELLFHVLHWQSYHELNVEDWSEQSMFLKLCKPQPPPPPIFKHLEVSTFYNAMALANSFTYNDRENIYKL